MMTQRMVRELYRQWLRERQEDPRRAEETRRQLVAAIDGEVDDDERTVAGLVNAIDPEARDDN